MISNFKEYLVPKRRFKDHDSQNFQYLSKTNKNKGIKVTARKEAIGCH